MSELTMKVNGYKAQWVPWQSAARCSDRRWEFGALYCVFCTEPKRRPKKDRHLPRSSSVTKASKSLGSSPERRNRVLRNTHSACAGLPFDAAAEGAASNPTAAI